MIALTLYLHTPYRRAEKKNFEQLLNLEITKWEKKGEMEGRGF
jgi:hypothetical protein